MSDQHPLPFDPDQAERLDAAIEAIASGGTPSTGDAQLAPLVALAARLHNDLPRDLPDPAFRERLKLDLARQVPAPVAPKPSKRRFPDVVRHFPIYGSVAAVVAVALVAGFLVFVQDDDRPSTPTTTARLMQATSIATMQAISSATQATSAEAAFQTMQATVASATEPAETAKVETATESTTAPTVTAAAPASTSSTEATATTPATEPSTPTAATQLAVVPSIDPSTIEQGPVPAADGGGSGPSADVTYVIDAAPAVVAATSVIYYLAPPSEDPVAFCQSMAERAGMSTDDVYSTNESGRMEVFAGTPGGGTLYWRPDSGVFQISSSAAGEGAELTEGEIVDAAQRWLAALDYPTETLGAPIVDDFGELWQVQFPMANMPSIGVGYPLGVSLMLHRDGTPAEARGYWLTVNQEAPVDVISVERAWDSVTHGGGYWRDGGMSAGGGEFRAESVQLSSILTTDGGELKLLPVYEFRGEFTMPDGSSAPISVFVRASTD
ncbi:MAG: hypothetical protein M9890_09070 [Thermomicrobiales bacterium]|nr:hypothetical protein [Thermomicrobiales bacterium]